MTPDFPHCPLIQPRRIMSIRPEEISLLIDEDHILFELDRLDAGLLYRDIAYSQLTRGARVEFE